MSPNIRRGPMTPTEDALLSKIETALDNVLQELDLPRKEDAHVYRQKYVYLSVKEFTAKKDEPITYSWFKWGVSAKAGPGSKSPGNTLYTDESLAGDLFEANVSDIENYLKNEIEHLPLNDWWTADFLDFLEQFYRYYGEEPYRELYLSNIRMHRLLDDITFAALNGRNPVREETFNDALDISSELKQDILSIDHLENGYEVVSDFTNLLQDVLLCMKEMEGDDIEKGHKTVISELKKFYRDHVWLIIAHSISMDTARGPSANLIRSDSATQLEKLRASFPEELEDNRRRADAVGLLPDIQDYPKWGSDEGELDEEDIEDKVEEALAIVDKSVYE